MVVVLIILKRFCCRWRFLSWPLSLCSRRSDRGFSNTDRTSISDKGEVINWSKMTTMKQASCEATHVHYVTVSVGLWLEYIKGSGSKFSFIPDWWPCRRTDLWGGLTSEGWGSVLVDQPGRGWGKMELEVNFRAERREGTSQQES